MKKFVVLFLILLLSFAPIAQISVHTDGYDTDPSAMLDVLCPQTKASLFQ